MPPSPFIPKPAEPSHYFPALTGVRALACYLILIYHLNPLNDTMHPLLAVRWLTSFIQQLYIGVQVFFVLSGFLIAHRYLASAAINRPWLQIYFWNRFSRIYPLYFILTLAVFLLLQYFPNQALAHWHVSAITWKDKVLTIIVNLTLTKAYFKSFMQSGLPSAWSLTLEETFYILAPVLLLGLRKRPLRLLWYPLLLLGLGSLLVAIANLIPHHLYTFMKSMNWMVRFTFFGHCIEFLCGIGLALYLNRRTMTPTGRSWNTPGGAAGIFICIVSLAISEANYLPTTAWDASAWSILVQHLVLPFAIVLFFHGLIKEKTWLCRLLSSRLSGLLGRSSYALYLINIGIFNELFDYYISTNFFIKIASYSLVAILLYTYIEQPTQRYLRHKQPNPPPARDDDAATESGVTAMLPHPSARYPKPGD